jgi:sulfur carrier protein ThiS adenylyltransferase
MKRETMRAAFSRAKVGIAGAGGLGSNCAVALARAGVRRFAIADFDIVTEANLDRQYYFRSQIGSYKVDALAENLLAIEPNLELELHRERLDADSVRRLFRGCDAIVEAFDDAGAKAMLIETALDAFPNAQIVAASGLAGVGSFETLKVLRKGNLIICGDFEREVSEDNPPVAPRVAIVAGMEADAVLEGLLSSLH